MVRVDGVFDKTLNMGAIIDGARLVSVNVNTYALNFDCLFHI